MKFQIYNSFTKQKEAFVPFVSNQVKIYVCGVTVYDLCHIGHARGAVNFDVLRSFLEWSGYEVNYIKNYTDVEDKIILRANQSGISPKVLSESMIKLHDRDMSTLGVRFPTTAPKATEHISEIIELTQTLIQKKFAYEIEGNVFFKIRNFKNYGRLSGKNIDDLESGSRVEINKDKIDALDFTLWKTAKPGEPSWESHWGPGRPGWHIECSAMAAKYLGKTFDIHAGGDDLIFPHHENEIAQSECAYGKTFANYWMHNGMVRIQGQKMSKSLGNFATIEDLIKKYHPELLRFYLLSTHYRQTLNFDHSNIIRLCEGLDRIYTALRKIKIKYGTTKIIKTYKTKQTIQYQTLLIKALNDDLNTPQAIGVLFEITKYLNKEIPNPGLAVELSSLLKESGQILGILGTDPEDWFQNSRIKNESAFISDEKIAAMILKRKKARQDKKWELADQIRNELAAFSVQIEDRDEETIWKRK